MSRKYEIINVGGVNRVRALRSWVVQGRQVNAGDVGGAVFDERTLSQDGDAWIFSGRFDNPLVRIGGDSVVSIGEVDSPRYPHLNIFGTSSIDANFRVSFGIGSLNDARPLTPAMMEQGSYDGAVGQKISKRNDPNSIRKTAKMFTGGGAFTIPAPAEGYQTRVIIVDENDIVTQVSTYATGANIFAAGAHSYVYLNVVKTPRAAIVPADVTAAALTFPDYAGATINIVDSHVTLSGTGSEGYVMISASGEYQGNVTNIEGSSVQVNRTAGTHTLNLFCDLINTTATVNMAASDITVQGVHRNVKNLVWGLLNWSRISFFRTWIQATDCNNFVMDGINIPVETANASSVSKLPLVFIRCNMNKAKIVNQPLIKNTYVDINFDLASADLDKLTAGHIMSLVSSNVNGMYRLQSGNGTNIGALVESYESVKDLNIASSNNITKSYNTTVYADAYLKGTIIVEGTNVFGGSRSHGERTFDASRMAVQGTFNPLAVGQAITGVVANATRVCIPVPFKLRGALGISVKGITGTDLRFVTLAVDAKGVISSISAATATDKTLEGTTQNDSPFVYVVFNNAAGSAIKPEDLAGVTITTYSGCKIVNTKTDAMSIRGNVRVEGNAVLKDISVEGTGYFGGESVTETPSGASVPLSINGYAFMKDNAVFSPRSITSSSNSITRLHMQDNARMTGSFASTNANLFMKDNANYAGHLYGVCDISLEDQTIIPAGRGVTAASYGKFTMKGKAQLGGNITIKGDITLCDNYRNTADKIYSGKRVIDSQDAPLYDDNVKTKYDF